METWEYATLGMYADTNGRTLLVWREAAGEPCEISDAQYQSRLADAGRAGWELVAATSSSGSETLHFKRPLRSSD